MALVKQRFIAPPPNAQIQGETLFQWEDEVVPEVDLVYVNTASEGGDGTTPDLVGPHAAFASLNDALTATVKDRVAAGAGVRFICAGAADTDPVRFTGGWVTSADCRVEVVVDPASRHNGYWDESKYHVVVTDDEVLHNLSDGVNHLYMDGVQAKLIVVTNVSHNAVRLMRDGVGLLELNGILARVVLPNGADFVNYGFRFDASGMQTLVTNCVSWFDYDSGSVYPFGRGFFYSNDISAPGKLYNCTSYGASDGIRPGTSGNIVVRNCVAQGSINGFREADTYGVGTSHNVSQNDFAPGTDGITLATVEFSDSLSGDFRLTPDDVAAYGTGVNLTSEGFDYDAAGLSRGSVWDRGANQLTGHEAPAGPSLTKEFTGLLAGFVAGDAENPFVVDDWSTLAGHAVTLGAEGQLRIDRSSGSGWLHFIRLASANLATRFVQGTWSRYAGSTSNWSGVGLHVQSDNRTGFAGIMSTRRTPELHGIERTWNGGSAVLINSIVSSKNLIASNPHRLSFSADGADMRTYDFTSGNLLEGTYEGVDNPVSGQSSIVINTQWIEFWDFFEMTSDHLTVSGLPNGASVEVRDAEDNVLASAFEVGGVASVDMIKVAFPNAVTVAVVANGNDVVTLTPPDGVWGGDLYTFVA